MVLIGKLMLWWIIWRTGTVLKIYNTINIYLILSKSGLFIEKKNETHCLIIQKDVINNSLISIYFFSTFNFNTYVTAIRKKLPKSIISNILRIINKVINSVLLYNKQFRAYFKLYTHHQSIIDRGINVCCLCMLD